MDDRPENLRLLVEALTRRGYVVRVAPGGALALRSAASDPPDLILLDVAMPDMSGYEVCARLKQDERLRSIPVIFISAMGETIDKVRAFDSGGVDYVTKPFHFEEVEARVVTHLELRELQAALVAQNRALAESYARLKELERLRDGLVHMVVHDMNSPLASLVASLQLLGDDLGATLAGEQREDLEAALESARRLARMTASLVDVSRLEEGKVPLRREVCDLGALVDRAVQAASGTAAGCRPALRRPREALPVSCDPCLIQRVLENLLANARRVTPRQGAITMALEAQGGTARVAITDAGPAIPPEHQPSVFEKFGQVEVRSEGQKHATGLDLAFCKLVVEAHGGRIGVECAPEGGRTFWFALPCE